MTAWPESVAELSRLEHESLRAFVESCAEHFTGRVLDYGCGRQPYRDVIEEAGGEYLPYDRKAFPGGSVGDHGPSDPLYCYGPTYTKADRERNAARTYNAILCTQVIEYVPLYGETTVGTTYGGDDYTETETPLLDLLGQFGRCLRSGGVLVLTGPTSWIEPPGHLHNFTQAGIRRLLEESGFVVERLECRGKIGPGLSIGYGAVARA